MQHRANALGSTLSAQRRKERRTENFQTSVLIHAGPAFSTVNLGILEAALSDTRAATISLALIGLWFVSRVYFSQSSCLTLDNILQWSLSNGEVPHLPSKCGLSISNPWGQPS